LLQVHCGGVLWVASMDLLMERFLQFFI